MITKYESATQSLSEAIKYGVQMMIDHGTRNFKYSGGLPKNDYGATYTTYNEPNERHGINRHGVLETIPNIEIFAYMEKKYIVPMICLTLGKLIYSILQSNKFNPMTHIVDSIWVEVSESEVRVFYMTSEWSPPTEHEFLKMTRMRI